MPLQNSYTETLISSVTADGYFNATVRNGVITEITVALQKEKAEKRAHRRQHQGRQQEGSCLRQRKASPEASAVTVQL